MKSTVRLAAAILALSLLTHQGYGASLLGGLITTGADSGNSDELISTNTDGDGTSIGLLGSNGLSVNLPAGGTGGSVGVPDVVEASTASSGGGTTAGVEILGGGNDVSINPLGLLGDSGGVTVGLPALGGAGGSNGNDGNDGNNGSNGSNGGNGSGTNGLVINYFANANGGGSGGLGGTTGGSRAGNGGSGGSFVIPPGISSRLQGLLRILAERDYLRISNGRAVCLNSFGVAEIASSIPRRDWAKLQQALSAYSDDIFTLRQLLANCRSRAQRQALNLTDLNRVIALDVGADGRPVLYML